MTEDEAKTKYCPSPGARENGHGMPDAMCIGSACMAWRWKRSDATRTKIEAIRDYRDRTGETLQAAKDAVERDWVEPKTEGYCGLAGAQP